MSSVCDHGGAGGGSDARTSLWQRLSGGLVMVLLWAAGHLGGGGCHTQVGEIGCDKTGETERVGHVRSDARVGGAQVRDLTRLAAQHEHLDVPPARVSTQETY